MKPDVIERTKRIVRGRFQETGDSVQQLSETTSIELETLLQMEGGELKQLEEVKYEFDSLHSKLLPTTFFDSIKTTVETENRKEIEYNWIEESEKISKSYAKVTATVHAYRIRYEKAKPRQSIVVNSILNDSSNDVSNKSKLKQIEPPKFDGNSRKFFEFKELFASMIHENDNLSIVRNMYYLKEAAIGEAAVLFHDFGVSEASYSQA